MSENPEQTAESLERELDALGADRNRLNKEALRWADNRDLLHEEIRKLRLEAKTLRQERDESNTSVNQLKILREEAKKGRSAKIERLRALRKEIRELFLNRPNRRSQSFENEIRMIEWKIQTEMLSLDEERRLVDRVKALEAQMSIYRQIESIEDKIGKIQKEVTRLDDERAFYNEKISELAKQGQRFHKKMIEKLEKVKRLKAEADEMHKKYVELKEQANALHEKHYAKARQIKALRKKIREREQEEMAKREDDLRKKLLKEALVKLKRREKLTFEEFRILAEKGEI